MSVPSLVQPETFTSKFEAGDSTWFLTAAEAEVRKYCGWHIAPSVDVIAGKYRCGERGLIMLKSLHVTAIDSVTVDGRELAADEFDWEECGFISRRCPSWPHDPYARVSFTHGHEECPADVAAVVFELASSAIALPAVPAAKVDITGGPFRLGLTGASLGVSLSKDQKDRLATYRLQGIA